jgi:hypothetical protein
MHDPLTGNPPTFVINGIPFYSIPLMIEGKISDQCRIYTHTTIPQLLSLRAIFPPSGIVSPAVSSNPPSSEAKHDE